MPRYAEPTCTVCGCTEFTPCIGGPAGTCWWVSLDRKTKAGLCSSCEAKQQRAKKKKGRRR